MSDTNTDQLKSRPGRAESWQADSSGRDGAAPQKDEKRAEVAKRKSVREQMEQSDTARDNNSQGYG